MAWVRLADDFYDHPKVLQAGPLASWLWVCGLAYANHYLTDGFLPAGVIRRLADVEDAPQLAARLVTVRLWESCEGGYRIHDYATYQPTAEQVKVERAANARRQDLYRNQDLTKAVRDRDGDVCRYCVRGVVWRDRRGPAGGTYDHVDPTGPNALENLVVCCRACNSAKGSRTPAGAGMVLHPVPGRNGAETGQVRADPGRNGSSDYVPPGPGPVPGPVNPAPFPSVSSPQPPPPAEGERRSRRRGRTDVDSGPLGDVAPPPEVPPLSPLAPTDAALWERCREQLREHMSATNWSVLIAPLEPLGRAADGGLYLRAPPLGQGVGTRALNHVRKALLDQGEQAAQQSAIIEGHGPVDVGRRPTS